jgi:hypothetical protein
MVSVSCCQLARVHPGGRAGHTWGVLVLAPHTSTASLVWSALPALDETCRGQRAAPPLTAAGLGAAIARWQGRKRSERQCRYEPSCTHLLLVAGDAGLDAGMSLLFCGVVPGSPSAVRCAAPLQQVRSQWED